MVACKKLITVVPNKLNGCIFFTCNAMQRCIFPVVCSGFAGVCNKYFDRGRLSRIQDTSNSRCPILALCGSGRGVFINGYINIF